MKTLDKHWGKPLPTLRGLAKLQRIPHTAKGEQPGILKAIEETFSEVKEGLLPGGAWSWVAEIKDIPNQLASGLLIEGYGRLLEKHFLKGQKLEQEPRLSRVFVLAFEEVLFTKHGEFELLGDVIGWMREESDDFPEAIASQLEPS